MRRGRVVSLIVTVGLLVGLVTTGLVGGQVSVGPIDYGPTITTDRDKLIACYSLIEQMHLEYNRQSDIATADPDRYAEKFRAYVAKKYDPVLRVLLIEYGRLKNEIIKATYTPEEWRAIGLLSMEEYPAVEVALFGNRTVESAKLTPASYAALNELKLIDLGDVTPIGFEDPAEDFTTYTEYEEAEDPISITSAKVTWTSMKADWYTSYVVKSQGANHFAGDFEHRYKTQTSSLSTWCGGATWMLSDYDDEDVYDQRSIPRDHLDQLTYNHLTGGYQWQIREVYGGSSYSDTTYDPVIGLTIYYVTVDRTEGSPSTFTYYICTGNYHGESGSSAVDTLSLNLHGDQDFDCNFALATYDAGGNSGRTWTGYVEDLDLQEAAAALSYSYGYVIGGGP